MIHSLLLWESSSLHRGLARGFYGGRLRLEKHMERNVLVIDDNEIVASTMAMVLRSAGFHAVAAYDCDDALALLKNESFQLLLSDAMMPKMSGVELAIEARDHSYVSQVLLMSGMASTSDLLESARNRGYAFEMLPKPSHPTDVINKVQAMLGR
jgi:two-component system alkaline phosphatase synthesis response regulator PhoP